MEVWTTKLCDSLMGRVKDEAGHPTWYPDKDEEAEQNRQQHSRGDPTSISHPGTSQHGAVGQLVL